MPFSWLLRTARRNNLIPKVSPTERQALEAGTVWVDGELFSGKPDLPHLASLPYPTLDDTERTFLHGPVEELCRRTDPWQLHQAGELPPEIWDFLREHRFFGLAIPPEYGGHGFSALAQSTIYAKLASRSLALSAVVLIPNSVGPGELLLEYGTAAQRDHWLPRLARGDEIPCFALTEPDAGSDAAALSSRGVVVRGDDGEPRIRLDWHKRYITLAPVATLLGLAVRLEDPDGLLDRGSSDSTGDSTGNSSGDLGITVLLVPTHLPGVEVGRRHDPMGIPFPNGPTTGRGVEVPVDAILGGPQQAGRGWRMLMEALSGGRAVSLPAQSVGGLKTVARVTGAYAAVRRQFGVPIARFEGIREPLARLAGWTYLAEAARVTTCGALDAGERPAVISAIMKSQTTELLRRGAANGMDVLGGTALMLGPQNPLAGAWTGAPIGITVEGANILTRSLIVFGQGALRCHPHLGRLMAALEEGDPKALRRASFGAAFGSVRNVLRATWLHATRGRFVRSPSKGPTARYWRRLAWASAMFAMLADTALVLYGPGIKKREAISGRFADALSWTYLATCTLRRFEAEGRREEDEPLMRWAAEHALARVQEAFEGLYANLRAPGVGGWLRGAERLWLRLNALGREPSDRLGTEAAAALTQPGPRRDRLTADVFVCRDPDDARGRIEHAFELAARLAAGEEALRDEAEAARRQAVAVDEFPPPAGDGDTEQPPMDPRKDPRKDDPVCADATP